MANCPNCRGACERAYVDDQGQQRFDQCGQPASDWYGYMISPLLAKEHCNYPAYYAPGARPNWITEDWEGAQP